MSKYCFKKDSFYNYTVRSTTINNTDMYLVNDVIYQYNIEHNTNKSFLFFLIFKLDFCFFFFFFFFKVFVCNV